MGALRPRGSALVAVLLLTTVLFLLGIALLSQKSSQYEAANRPWELSQCRQLAQAGLVDCQLKLAKDRTFPPLSAANGTYTYSETLTALDGSPLGSYTVQMDYGWMRSPYYVCHIRSRGWMGSPDRVRADFTLFAEIDMARTSRLNSNQPNPSFRKLVNYLEEAPPPQPAP